MSWPNNDSWLALVDGGQFMLDDHTCTTSVIDCGMLLMPTGRLVARDPFAGMERTGNRSIALPPGTYPVRVTLADVSEAGDGSHIREAYASLLLHDAPEAERRILTPLLDGEEPPTLAPGEFSGIPVDAGTVCFVDADALASGMPDGSWMELFQDAGDDSWFDRMDDPAHIRAGIANITLPLAQNGENIVIIHSGWGDGYYPLIGGYDAAGELVAVHIDLFVVPDPEGEGAA